MPFNEDFAILIHGYSLLTHKDLVSSLHLGPRSWNNVAWGNIDNHLMGRVLFGVYLALMHKPLMLIFGTGASCIFENKPISRSDWEEKGRPENIEWDSDFTFNYLMENFDELMNFPLLKDVIVKLGGISNAKKHIDSISEIENKSKNTSEEIINALSLCNKNKNIKYLLRVTSPSHDPRCVSYQINSLREYSGNVEQVFSIPCETDFSEDEDVLIFEPQSGPGVKRKKSPCNILNNFFSLSYEEQNAFLNLAEEFFENHNLLNSK